MATREERLALAAAARAAAQELAETKLDEFGLQYGDDAVALVHSVKGPLILARKDGFGAAYRRWRYEVTEGSAAKRTDAGPKLARSALVHPDLATYDAWVAECPGVADIAANAARRLGGDEEEKTAGKS